MFLKVLININHKKRNIYLRFFKFILYTNINLFNLYGDYVNTVHKKNNRIMQIDN